MMKAVSHFCNTARDTGNMVRAASPALSENEFDISKSLAAGGFDSDEANSDIELPAQPAATESEDEEDAAFIAATQAAVNRKNDSTAAKKAGAFKTMGLNSHLLKAITRKGFTVPTPIQRKTIPLIMDGQDVVAMARTGSGKTAAFVIPMIEKLKSHSAKVGARAVVLSPSRELALQTLKVVKEMGRGTDLRTTLLVGGDSLEDQFGSMASNPDIIIATPGRFEHLKVEMGLELSSVKYVVFDEADRLFEMGFAAQLHEIMYSLPSNRQTLLFSATLPKSLVEFARAGLQDPKLVRLDAESKIAPGLQSAFFTVKRAEKEAYGYATSYVYGSLDQTARKMQVQDFRSGVTNILVVTDVAARGLDVPLLANVINYDFPSQPKIFVHRVGRTARAGKEGWSYSLITQQDMPYLLDLQLFLSRRLVLGRTEKEPGIFQNTIVLGSLRRDKLEPLMEESAKLIEEDDDLSAMRDVAAKGEKQYLRTRNAASAESVKRAKTLAQSGDTTATNMLFEEVDQTAADEEQRRLDMLAKVSGFRPAETVFEVGQRGKLTEAAEVMRKRRAKIEPKFSKKDMNDSDEEEETVRVTSRNAEEDVSEGEDELVLTQPNGADMEEASDDEIELTFTAPDEPQANGKKKRKNDTGQDSDFFMSYTPSTINMAEDRGYGVHSGGTNANSHFLEQARGATMDLTNDEDSGMKEARSKGLRWDKKSKKYVQKANDEDGSKGARMIRGESGQKIAASFKSGRFDAWKKANRVERLPRVGEQEKSNAHFTQNGGKRYKHKQEKAPKQADKYRDDYYKRKKRVDEAKEKRVGQFADGKGKNELRGVEDVRKLRKLQERRKEKNARPSRKGRA
ncbi:ATP-dependent RNA helicase dbp10 [Pseudocercospora fuligena]|uniref:RNA helicase n=1 Tax=Pseudocercospora fuligena TaxID=685502 RepID=A0A8H6RTQ5_9PEZI|nr:ATP-dependent RNA helicase dbp10 [Pseudocercospora fuligena]